MVGGAPLDALALARSRDSCSQSPAESASPDGLGMLSASAESLGPKVTGVVEQPGDYPKCRHLSNQFAASVAIWILQHSFLAV